MYGVAHPGVRDLKSSFVVGRVLKSLWESRFHCVNHASQPHPNIADAFAVGGDYTSANRNVMCRYQLHFDLRLAFRDDKFRGKRRRETVRFNYKKPVRPMSLLANLTVRVKRVKKGSE